MTQRIGENRVKNLAITVDKVANNAITVDKVANNAITVDKVANNAITTHKVANNSITVDKVANNAITVDKVANNSITVDKVANNAITVDKVANNAITVDKVANNAITTHKVANNSITVNKFATVFFGSTKVNFGTEPVYETVYYVDDSRANVGANVIVVSSAYTSNNQFGSIELGNDELIFDNFHISANVINAGNITLYITTSPGPVKGERNFNYIIS